MDTIDEHCCSFTSGALQEPFSRLPAIKATRGVLSVKGIRLNPNSRLNVLTGDQVEAVHDASLRILERTGIRYDSEDARKRLLNAGAAAHPTRKGVITFPRSMVEDALGRITRRNVFPARDRRWDVEFDGEHMFPYAGGGDPKIIDIDTDLPRHSTYRDVEMAARLGDALGNNHFASSLVMANDVLPELVVMKTMEATMKNSGKAVTGYAPDRETVDALVRMWTCVSGGAEELRKRPLFSLGGSPSSPLTYSEHNCDALLRSVEHGIPFAVLPCPICGETGPMTLGGAIAQQNAEHLGGIMLMQTVTTDLPTFYSGRVCVMDPRSGRDLWGVPEEGLLSAAMVQIARRYGMVSDSNGMSSDITRWDVQMGLEQMMTVMMPALAGTDSISGLGCGWNGASSLVMMVIGNEVFDDVARMLRGIRIDEGSLAVDLIDKVGHMGNFLTEPHTMDSIRSGEVRIPHLWDKRSPEMAIREGFKPIQETAKDAVKRILGEHVPEPLDRDVVRGVEQVVKEASKTLLRRP
ncbi:MAG: trimethylamine methyltransferase family protein [Thermoplasmata archaeon]|nr:trimethylamine methyltransferase family protein [Thermoplasmata archaeon]